MIDAFLILLACYLGFGSVMATAVSRGLRQKGLTGWKLLLCFALCLALWLPFVAWAAATAGRKPTRSSKRFRPGALAGKETPMTATYTPAVIGVGWGEGLTPRQREEVREAVMKKVRREINPETS